EYVWGLHFSRSLTHGGVAASGIEWALVVSWTQALHLTGAMALYAVLGGMSTVVGSTRMPRLWEYASAVVLSAAAIAMVFLQIVFPNFAFGTYAPTAVAVVAGGALAL